MMVLAVTCLLSMAVVIGGNSGVVFFFFFFLIVSGDGLHMLGGCGDV